jgi:hypothetical protein
MGSTDNGGGAMAPPLTVAISVFNRDKSRRSHCSTTTPHSAIPTRNLIIDNGSKEGSWELPQGVRKDWPQRRVLRNKISQSTPLLSLPERGARGEL